MPKHTFRKDTNLFDNPKPAKRKKSNAPQKKRSKGPTGFTMQNINAYKKSSEFITARQLMNRDRFGGAYCYQGAKYTSYNQKLKDEHKKYKKKLMKNNKGVPKEYKKKVVPFTKWIKKLYSKKQRRREALKKWSCGKHIFEGEKKVAATARGLARTIVNNRMR